MRGDRGAVGNPVTSWTSQQVARAFTSAIGMRPTLRNVAGRQSIDYDGVDDVSNSTDAISTIMTSVAWWSSGIFIIDANPLGALVKNWTGVPIVADNNGWWGPCFMYWDGANIRAYAFQFSGGTVVTPDAATTIVTPGAVMYYESFLSAGTMHFRLNAGVDQTVASGATGDVTNPIRLGDTGLATPLNGVICEDAVLNVGLPSAANVASWRAWARERYGATTP
jgi:hypothetical protein